ncbi:IclR family transcriptional regulator [Acetobacter conturbans]|uniref:Helix-turn-helix domain-containing protein n=1 Tax=Acetobacter conturbans TaxID=1737472 RepID=A0ABX0JYC1_9PROT|nr:IclR family transcriptional regulator [Acetobacter conturbans]NHN88486.1 helix-turn-helix domain-containing protein [Acetobacter conturbans]
MKENESVPALRRAVKILDLVSSQDTPLNAASIARMLDLPRSSAHGLVGVMTELGLLEATGGAGSGFRLGARLLDWAIQVSPRQDLLNAFHQVVGEHPELSAYTVSLSTLDGEDVVYVASRDNEKGFGVHYNVGLRLPAMYTATGMAQLGAMEPAVLRQWLTLYPLSSWPAPPATAKSLVPSVVMDEIAEVRRKAYAVDDEQIHMGVWCFAAPVHDLAGAVIAGLGISQPKPKDSKETEETIGHLVRSIARVLSGRLGYRGRWGATGE